MSFTTKLNHHHHQQHGHHHSSLATSKLMHFPSITSNSPACSSSLNDTNSRLSSSSSSTTNQQQILNNKNNENILNAAAVAAAAAAAYSRLQPQQQQQQEYPTNHGYPPSMPDPSLFAQFTQNGVSNSNNGYSAAAAAAAYAYLDPLALAASGCYQTQYANQQGCAAAASSNNLYHQSPNVMNGDGTRRKNATRETTATLKAWLYEHRKNPYPTKGEKIMLAIITKMTLNQVSTWFANARRRLKKENKMSFSPRNK